MNQLLTQYPCAVLLLVHTSPAACFQLYCISVCAVVDIFVRCVVWWHKMTLVVNSQYYTVSNKSSTALSTSRRAPLRDCVQGCNSRSLRTVSRRLLSLPTQLLGQDRREDGYEVVNIKVLWQDTQVAKKHTGVAKRKSLVT